MRSPLDGPSFSALLGDVLNQFSKLVQNEIALARAEISDKATKAKGGLTFIGAGVVLMMPAITVLLLAIAAGLIALGLSAPLACLIVAIVAGGGAYALIAAGLHRLSPEALSPNLTLEELRRDGQAAKEIIQ